MEPLTVRALMSSPVITVTPETRLPQIKRLMREHTIRRLPVVERDRLVGIITFGDVRNAFPSDAPTLSIYELSDLLTRVTAAEIMQPEVITVAADAQVAEVAQKMLRHKIGGMPVLEEGRLVGIISESDIFRAVIGGQIALTASGLTRAASPTARARI